MQDLLNRFQINFYKNNGCPSIICHNDISRYLYIWRTEDIIIDFLNNIDLCLSGKYEEIEDPWWDDGLIKLYGNLQPSYLQVFTSDRIDDKVILDKTPLFTIPLTEFKVILIAWKEFINKSGFYK